jgi:hypothetical protein
MPCSRILVIVLTFVALTGQMFAVQSHFHSLQSVGKAQDAGSIAHVADAGAGSSSSAQSHKYPVNDDPSKCPLCQQLGHSGQFVVGATVLFLVCFFVAVRLVVLSESVPALLAVRHNWQSRAPPQG